MSKIPNRLQAWPSEEKLMEALGAAEKLFYYSTQISRKPSAESMELAVAELRASSAILWFVDLIRYAKRGGVPKVDE